MEINEYADGELLSILLSVKVTAFSKQLAGIWYSKAVPSVNYWLGIGSFTVVNSSLIVNYIFPIAPGSLASLDFAFISIEIVLSQF